MRVAVAGVYGNCLVQCRLGIIFSFQARVGDPDAYLGVDIIGIKLHGFSEVHHSVFKTPQLAICDSQVV